MNSSPIQPEALFEHKPFVRALARVLVKDAHVAADLEQDTWLAAIRRPPGKSESILSWLGTVTRHLAHNFYRGEARRSQRERSVARAEMVDSTESIVEKLAIQRAVVDAVLLLKPIHREVVLLRYFEGRSHKSIAHHLGVAESTVRTRVHRALAILRQRLDAKYGTMQSWSCALLGLIRSPAGRSGMEVGAWSLPKACFVTSSLVLLGAVWFCSDDLSTSEESSEMSSSTRFIHGSYEASRSESGEERFGSGSTPGEKETRIEGRLSAQDPTPINEGDEVEVGSPSLSIVLGQVVLRTVDGASGRPLSSEVRFMSIERFAKSESSGEARSLFMTPGVYEARISSPGHEPRSVASFSIAAGEVTDLGTLSLARGAGGIEGQVVADFFDWGDPFQIELYGRGRHRCFSCSDLEHADVATEDGSCLDCGFWEEKSVLHRRAGEPFSFPALASGTYYLRVFQNDRHPVGRMRVVELGESRWEWVDLTLGATATLDIELIDDQGFPFEGFERDGLLGKEMPEFRVTFDRRGVQIASAEIAGRRDTVSVAASLSALAAVSIRTSVLLSLVASQRQRIDFLQDSSILLATDTPDRGPRPIDRERTPADSLDRDPSVRPDFPAASLTVEALGFSSVRVEPLPRKRLTLAIEWGHFGATEVRCDLRTGSRRVVVVIEERPDAVESSISKVLDMSIASDLLGSRRVLLGRAGQGGAGGQEGAAWLGSGVFEGARLSEIASLTGEMLLFGSAVVEPVEVSFGLALELSIDDFGQLAESPEEE